MTITPVNNYFLAATGAPDKERTFYSTGMAVLEAFKKEDAQTFIALIRKLEKYNRLDVLVDIETAAVVTSGETKELATKVIETIVSNLLSEHLALNRQDKRHQNVINPILASNRRTLLMQDKLINLWRLDKAPKLQARLFKAAKKDRPDTPVAIKAMQPSCLGGYEKGSYMTGLTLTFTGFPKNTGTAQVYTLTPIKGTETPDGQIDADEWPQHGFDDCTFSADFGVCSGIIYMDDSNKGLSAFIQYHHQGRGGHVSYVDQYKPKPLGESEQFKIASPYYDGYCKK